MSETNATPAGDRPPETAAPPVFPPGRYGRRRAPRRGPRWARPALVVAGTLMVAVVGTVLAATLAERYGGGRPYDATVERFYDITDQQVVVEFTVVVPAGEVAICAVRARAGHGGEVGREEVRVAPPPGVTRPRVVHRLPTTERPVTGEVQRCWEAADGG